MSIRSGALFLAAAIVLAACGDGGGGGAPSAGGGAAAPAAGKKTYTFYFCPKMLDNEVFNYARSAAERRARELSGDAREVKIQLKAPLKGDAAEQANIIRALVGQKVDGIMVSCNEPNALKRAIDEAVDAGIPIMCFDSDAPASRRKYVYANNDIRAGQVLAEELIKRLGPDPAGDVVLQSGVPGADNLSKRIEGAKQVLAKYPKIAVKPVLYCEDNVAKAVQDIAGYMNANPQTRGWILIGGWALFGKNALDPIDPAKTVVISFDALEPEWQYLESGKCAALVAQDVYGWGYKSVDILLHLIDPAHPLPPPGKADANGLIESEIEVVTKDNLEAFKAKWNTWFPRK